MGGCSETNDGVTDTAQQQQADYACYLPSTGNKVPNSCPNRPKDQPTSDPVFNYMGYSPGALPGFLPLQSLLLKENR